MTDPAPALAAWKAGGRLRWRKFKSASATLLSLAAVLLAIIPLVSLVWEVAKRGAPALSIEFLGALPTPPAFPGGGILHAIIGTGMVVGIGTAIGAPTGILAGIFVAEYKETRFADMVRLTADVMTGIPSIVAGLLGYALIVTRWGFSAYAGGVALAVIMIPIVTRTTEEALRTVPLNYREAAFALGAPRWYSILVVVLPAAMAPLITGLLLAVARIAGETAPLLLTVLGSFYLVTDPSEPVEALPKLILEYGRSASPKQLEQAWGAALVLLVLVLLVNLVVRILSRRKHALD